MLKSPHSGGAAHEINPPTPSPYFVHMRSTSLTVNDQVLRIRANLEQPGVHALHALPPQQTSTREFIPLGRCLKRYENPNKLQPCGNARGKQTIGPLACHRKLGGSIRFTCSCLLCIVHTIQKHGQGRGFVPRLTRQSHVVAIDFAAAVKMESIISLTTWAVHQHCWTTFSQSRISAAVLRPMWSRHLHTIHG